jgi:hypothetical protein
MEIGPDRVHEIRLACGRILGQTVAQFVEALYYNPEGRGFNPDVIEFFN